VHGAESPRTRFPSAFRWRAGSRGVWKQAVVLKLLVVALCATISLVAGLAAGILTALNGSRPAGAVLAGGGAFLATLPVALAVAQTLGGL